MRPGPPPGARGASGRRSFRSTGKGSGAGPRGGQPRERKAAETVDNNGNGGPAAARRRGRAGGGRGNPGSRAGGRASRALVRPLCALVFALVKRGQ